MLVCFASKKERRLITEYCKCLDSWMSHLPGSANRWPRSPNSLQPLEPLSHVCQNDSCLPPKSPLISPSQKPQKHENPHESYNGPSFLQAPTPNQKSLSLVACPALPHLSSQARDFRSPGTFSLSQSQSVHIPHKPTNYARQIHRFRTDLCKGRVATCACMHPVGFMYAWLAGQCRPKNKPFLHSLQKVRF